MRDLGERSNRKGSEISLPEFSGILRISENRLGVSEIFVRSVSGKVRGLAPAAGEGYDFREDGGGQRRSGRVAEESPEGLETECREQKNRRRESRRSDSLGRGSGLSAPVL